jgi:mannose-6-phosphate isomerase class I
MNWYPLRLSTPVRTYISGGRSIVDVLGKQDMPAWRVAETWEVSDVDGAQAVVRNGELGGKSLRELTLEHPGDMVGRVWHGEHFPLLTKFIDGAGMLPVHLHADDDAAQRLENEPHGKTEAWHILAAATGATALVGLKEGVDKTSLRDALLRQDYGSVMRRLPVRPGETIHVPGGTLHSFGPDTLLYEIQQTSDVLQTAMPYNMRDGSYIDTDEWHRNIDMLLQEIRLDSRPSFNPGLRIIVGDDFERLVCCASPYFALERWRIGNVAPARHSFETALIVTNVGGPAFLTSGAWAGELSRAETILLPAAAGSVEISGPADVLVGYLPDLEHDIIEPLSRAGYSREVIATLGEGLE